jgi:hypothetical protein
MRGGEPEGIESAVPLTRTFWSPLVGELEHQKVLEGKRKWDGKIDPFWRLAPLVATTGNLLLSPALCHRRRPEGGGWGGPGGNDQLLTAVRGTLATVVGSAGARSRAACPGLRTVGRRPLSSFPGAALRGTRRGTPGNGSGNFMSQGRSGSQTIPALLKRFLQFHTNNGWKLMMKVLWSVGWVN